MVQNNELYRCPVCHLSLKKGERSYFCSNKHSFDIARKGYVNLLLVNQKGSKEPGDTKEMVLSRRNFLAKGYYGPLAKKLGEIITQLTSTDKDDRIAFLDAGCGEGYFTCYLKDYLLSQNLAKEFIFWGIDISKPAVTYAASRDKEINFAVASNYNLPILSNSIDYIFWTFAPGDEKEFHRVLKNGGKLLMIIPGTKHLFGLKALVYEEAREHHPKDQVPAGFKIIDSVRVTYKIHLKESEDIMNLLAMTPYYWHISPAGKKKAEETQELLTEVDFLVMIYEKSDNTSDK